MYKVLLKKTGYSLVEMMVVVAVVGILASIVVISLEDSRDEARYAAAKQEIEIITDAALLAESLRSPLRTITGSNCSRCSCANGTDLRNISSGSACVSRWNTTLTNITNASPLQEYEDDLLRDPWGSPYLLDENEQEQAGNPCIADRISSAGPDGIYPSSDDYSITLPFRTGECS